MHKKFEQTQSAKLNQQFFLMENVICR